MSTQLASGVYRQWCDVVGPNGSARVERIDDDQPRRVRYTVRDGDGELIAICWVHGFQPDAFTPQVGRECDRLDGGWERAVSIAEHLTQGRANV